VRPQPTTRPATKALGALLLIVGAGLAAFSLLADYLDVGGGKGFGYQQMIVLIVGVVLILGGIRVLAQPYFSRLNGPQDFAEFER
jgi:hypothetical protein